MFQRPFNRGSFHKKRFHSGVNRRSHRGFQRGGNIHSSKYIQKAVIPTIQQEHVIKNRFEDFPIAPQLLQNILSHGYQIPTPIQDRSIPVILTGQDVVGIANTGTGKTAAFLVPLLHKLILDRTQKALIIVPTRELAVQIEDESRAFAKNIGVSSLLCIGGASINNQIMHLRSNPLIIIGTPGRLKDLINRHFLHLGQFKNIVLDEVDRMVDIGFIQDIRFIISHLPKERQSLFFSATVSPDVDSIIRSFVKNPITISVKVQETVGRVEQNIIKVSNKDEKLQKLIELLRTEEFKKVLIFGRTKWGVERLFKTLLSMGFLAGAIHGNKTQNQRLRVLTQFKNNQLKVLVATDVAARGLDIEDVSHVVNFDEPSTYTDYVHRIGRTGRANKEGKALTFVI